LRLLEPTIVPWPLPDVAIEANRHEVLGIVCPAVGSWLYVIDVEEQPALECRTIEAAVATTEPVALEDATRTESVFGREEISALARRRR
jgi:hypothetical protein